MTGLDEDNTMLRTLLGTSGAVAVTAAALAGHLHLGHQTPHDQQCGANVAHVEKDIDLRRAGHTAGHLKVLVNPAAGTACAIAYSTLNPDAHFQVVVRREHLSSSGPAAPIGEPARRTGTERAKVETAWDPCGHTGLHVVAFMTVPHGDRRPVMAQTRVEPAPDRHGASDCSPGQR